VVMDCCVKLEQARYLGRMLRFGFLAGSISAPRPRME
jgi:hypothetical protein